LALPLFDLLSDLSGAASPAGSPAASQAAASPAAALPAGAPAAAPARPRRAAPAARQAAARQAAAPACPPTAMHADAWIDGELSTGAAATIGAHLRSCPPCRAHVEALRRLVAVVRRQEAHRPPAPASLRARARELAAMWHDEEARAAEDPAPRRPAR
jgi:hypothetical protein